jgi:DNA-binding NarL/FixJ family response regulator
MRAKSLDREAAIIQLLVEACPDAEIAQRLHLAKRTVKAHLQRLFKKHGITHGIKRVQLATLMYRRSKCSPTSNAGSSDS